MDWTPPDWLAWSAVIVVALVWILVAWHSDGPRYAADEVSNIGSAARLGDPGTLWALHGSSYLPAMPVLLAPLWWVFDSAEQVYRAATFVVAAIGIATLWPLARLSQMFGLTRNAAIVVAAIVSIAPGRALYGNYVWGETVLALAFTLLVIAGIRLGRDRSARNAILFGVAAGGLFAAHGRALPIVAVAGIALLIVAAGAATRRAGILGAAAYVATLGAVYAVYQYTATANVSDVREAATLSSVADATAGVALDVLASQVWYQFASWSVLVFLGAAFLIARARRSRDAAAIWWLLAGFGGLLAFFSLFVAGSPSRHVRLDLHVYGRYLEGFSFILALLGLVAIVHGVTRARAIFAAASVVAVAGLFYLFSVPQMPPGGRVVGWSPAWNRHRLGQQAHPHRCHRRLGKQRAALRARRASGGARLVLARQGACRPWGVFPGVHGGERSGLYQGHRKPRVARQRSRWCSSSPLPPSIPIATDSTLVLYQIREQQLRILGSPAHGYSLRSCVRSAAE